MVIDLVEVFCATNANSNVYSSCRFVAENYPFSKRAILVNLALKVVTELIDNFVTVRACISYSLQEASKSEFVTHATVLSSVSTRHKSLAEAIFTPFEFSPPSQMA